MGLFIGTEEKFATNTDGYNLKFIKSTIIRSPNHKFSNIEVTVKSNHIVYCNSRDNYLLVTYHYYHGDIFLHYRFEAIYDDEFTKFVKDKLQYESCELLSLIYSHDMFNQYAIGILIEVPTLVAIKQKYNDDTLLSLYLILKFVLNCDVTKLIFMISIPLLIYQYYRDRYCKMIQSLPYSTIYCKQDVIQKRIECFDRYFRLWLDIHVNL